MKVSISVKTCAHEGHEKILRWGHGSLHRFLLQYSKDYAVSYSTLITPNVHNITNGLLVSSVVI